MAGRTKYIVANPNGEDHEVAFKTGRKPSFATWALLNGEWERIGWSYQATKLEAQAKTLADMRRRGFEGRVTRVLPAV